MGCMFSSCNPLKIIVLGPPKSGKTSLVHFLETNELKDLEDNLGPKWYPATYCNLKMKIFDLGSSEETLNDRDFYIKLLKIQCVFYVVDTSQKDLLEEAAHDFQKIMRIKELKGAPVVIFATRHNLRDDSAMSIDDLKALLQLKRHPNKCEVFLCDFRSGTGVREAIQWLKKETKTVKTK